MITSKLSCIRESNALRQDTEFQITSKPFWTQTRRVLAKLCRQHEASFKDAFICFHTRVALIFSGSLTNTGSLVLREARGALAGETPDGVDAQELAVMLLG